MGRGIQIQTIVKINILYKDKDIIVIDKPAGIPVETKRIGEADCESELKNNLAASGVKNPYLAVINRLDQPVRGVVLFALNKKSAAFLSKELSDNHIDKLYKARVYGSFDIKEGTLTDYLFKESATNTSLVVKEGDKRFKDSKKAVLDYKETSPGELDVKLITGRHHQIRVQLANAGHPILGDRKYGTKESAEEAEKKGIDNICLMAYELDFNHPSTMERIIIKSEQNI